jgi:hypothetical protein
VLEAECAQEDKIHAGQRLAAFATAGTPFAVPAATYAPSLQKPQDFDFPLGSNQWLALPSLEVNRDRIGEK